MNPLYIDDGIILGVPFQGISFSNYSMEDLMGNEEQWRLMEPACTDMTRGIASNRAASTTPQMMYFLALQDAISMWYERVDCESNPADELSRIELFAQDLCTKVAPSMSTADAQKLASGSASTNDIGRSESGTT